MNEKIKGEATNSTSDILTKQKINFNILLEQNDNNNDLNENNSNIYYVSKYSENSEDYTHIKKIISLKMTFMKRIMYYILNILTCSIINLFMKWFPAIKRFIRYSETPLYDATYLGV